MYFNQSVALSTMNSTAGYSVIVVALIGLSLIFFSLHFLGFNTMPRRYVDYSDNLQLHNQIATMFLMSFLLAPAISLLMVPGNVYCSSLAVMGNHLLAYQVPANISYLWCFGLT